MATRHSVSKLAALAVAASSLVACVAKAAPPDCSVVGAEFVAGAPSEADICRSFNDSLSRALTERGSAIEAAKIAVSIAIDKRGSSSAKVAMSRTEQSAPVEFPELTVDVMDRSMQMGDIETLADAVAKMIAESQG